MISTETMMRRLDQFKNPKNRRKYLEKFERTMIYRTSKMENPEITKQMVEKVLAKFHK